jgi:hypothetical protein
MAATQSPAGERISHGVQAVNVMLREFIVKAAVLQLQLS